MDTILCIPLNANDFYLSCWSARKYVPEVKRLPTKYLFEPWKAPIEVQRAARCVVGDDYPEPVADHLQQRRVCVERLKDVYTDLSRGGRCWTSVALGGGGGGSISMPLRCCLYFLFIHLLSSHFFVFVLHCVLFFSLLTVLSFVLPFLHPSIPPSLPTLPSLHSCLPIFPLAAFLILHPLFPLSLVVLIFNP